jgi:glycosyltransferase involved in cell wall biosynthesis
MMHKCELSIIIPIYNGARFLKDTLDSVLKQSFESYELILVDDGSTDDTGAICDSYAQKDNRIKVIHQPNGGMSNARDNGFKMAKDDTWIAFLDADDIFDRNMFRDLMSHRDSDLVCTCFKNVLSNKISSYSMDEQEEIIEQMTGEEMLKRFVENKDNKGPISRLWGMVFSRDFYMKMQPVINEAKDILPQNYLNDVYCMPRFFYYADKVTFLNRIYVAHRVSKYTDSRMIKPNALHYELALADKMNVEFYKEHNCEYAHDGEFIGFYIVMLKLWYQTVTAETDKEKQKYYMNQVEEYYKEYYPELSKVKCKSLSDKVAMFTIKLWGINKIIWKLLVGNIRYGLMYKI